MSLPVPHYWGLGGICIGFYTVFKSVGMNSYAVRRGRQVAAFADKE